MAPRQDPGRPGLHRPAKDPHRLAAFREAARAIVGKDRGDRRAGLSVDTAGAIARALERAYVRGYADAQAPVPPPSVPPTASVANDAADGPVEWVLIPPRPRNVFWTICLFVLGRGPAGEPDGDGHLHPAVLPNGRPGWQLATRHRPEDKPFGHATVSPLVRLGLLDAAPGPGPDGQRLVVSARGVATWRRFLERGGQFPEDLTDPVR